MPEDRYIRQLHCAPGFNQQRLKDATVMIAGVGGLGSTVSMLLAAAGVGALQLCDYDTVSISNLNRQLLYTEQDVYKSKVPLAAQKLHSMNPECRVTQITTAFSDEIMKAHQRPDLIMDCLDNVEGRVELIAYAQKYSVPLVHAAIHGFSGQFSFFLPNSSSCPVCSIVGEITDDNRTSPPSLGACVSVLGSYQATEAIKYLSGIGELCINKMMFFDLLTNTIELFDIEKNPACVACSSE